MNHSNKRNWTVAIIFFLIILFSLTLRIDLNNEYPKGADTYDMYLLAKNVQERGYVVWNIDFLTSIGMTSFSYPSGGIIFLAEISSITGLNMTNVILIWNVILIIIAALIVYLTAKEIFKDHTISLLTAVIYLNTRFFISYSTFYTSRNILHLFFLATIFLIVKKISFKNIFVVIFFLAMSFVTHRATALVSIFMLAFVISHLSYKYYKNNLFQNMAIVLAGAFMFFASVYFFGHSNIGSETTRIPITVGIQYLDDLLSILFTISMHFGILTLLLPLGYFFLVTKKEKSREDLFILIAITLSAAFVVETIYFFYLFLPILSFVVAYFLKRVFISYKSVFKNITIFIVIIALIMPIYITVTDPKSDILILRDPTVSLTIFLDENDIQKSVICNNHVIYCAQIGSVSENVTALTYTSARTLMDRINIVDKKLSLKSVRGKIVVTDDILGTSIYSDSYTSAIINWNTPKPMMDRLIEFTNLGYVIDSNNPDSLSNRVKLENKFKYMDNIYDNGLQQVKVIQ